MASDNIKTSGKLTDLSTRVGNSSTVVASPSANSETVIAQITGIASDVPVMSGVFISGGANFTVGTSGASIRLRIRTGTTAGSGTTIADTGAVTGGVSAGNLLAQDVQGFDTGATGGASPGTTSYCLTLTVGSGAATSTVSSVSLVAIII